MTQALIKNFNKISKADTEIAGGKGASLGEMIQAGIPVPDGFVILSDVFKRFLKETNLNVEIDTILNEVDIKEFHTVENVSEKIQAMIISKKIPEDIKIEILKFYKNLDCKFVAVRSSATSEDSASAAWAGQLDSFLNTIEETLLENVKKCWASLFTPRAIFYRFEKKLNKDIISVAVVVQKMVDSEESGIVFSVHPVTQDKNQIIIEAGFGLGEAIVSGSITPDTYVVDKQNFSILDINVNKQKKALYKKSKGGNKWRSLGDKGNEQVLTEKEIIYLSKLIVKIENHYDFPCDIEWAKEKGKFYIVQSRPVTTLTGKKKKDKELMVLLGAWNVMPLEAWKWFDAAAVNKFYSLTGVSLRAFTYIKDELHYQAFFEKEVNELKVIFKSQKTENDKIQYVKRIFDDCDRGAKKLENHLEKIEKEDIDKFSNQELVRAIQDFAELWTDITMQVWYALLIDIWFPLPHQHVKIKERAAVSRDWVGQLHERSNITERKVYEKAASTLLLKRAEINFLFPQEIINSINTGKSYVDNAIERSVFCVTISHNKEYRIYSGNKALELFDKYQPPSIGTESKNILQGTTACNGHVRGVARIIRRDKDFHKFTEGEILIALQTMIHYVPIMKKSKAILTEFGGLTSHAAIVARELSKPCVVGISNLLVSVTDGDELEVEADKGIIKILTKNKISLNLSEWEFDFQQRDGHPLIMADQWCKSLYNDFVEELNLNIEPYDYFFTGTCKGYVKTRQKTELLQIFFRAIKDQKYLDYVFEKTMSRVEELVDFSQKIKVHLPETKTEILKTWQDFNTLFLKVIPWFWIPYYLSEKDVLTNKVKDGLKKFEAEISHITDFNNALALLCFPTRDNKLQDEQKYLYGLVKFARENEDYKTNSEFNELIDNYLEKFSWTKTFIELPKEPLDRNGLLEKVIDSLNSNFIEQYELQKKQKQKNAKIVDKICKIIKNDQELIKAVNNARHLGWLLSVSVENSLIALANLIPFYKKIAKTIGVDYQDWVHFTVDEIETLIKGETLHFSLEDRRLSYIYIMKKGERRMYFGGEAKRYTEKISSTINKVDPTNFKIKGSPTSPGVVNGKVRVAMNPDESKNVQKGEILVTGMTSPDYVSAMKRAGAIVTDEGGLLSHAAIISRELGKPCIVGTKNATKILNDGDLVEVDANQGIVRILKTKKLNIIYEKVFTRDFSLPMLELWYKGEAYNPKPWSNQKQTYLPYIIFIREEGTVKSYYDSRGVEWIQNHIKEYAKNDKNFLLLLEKEVKEKLKPIQIIYDNEKTLSKNELMKFIEDFDIAYPWVEAMWWLCEMSEEDLKGLDISNIKKLREDTNKLSTGTDVVVRKSLAKIFPKLKDYVHVLKIDEIRKEIFPSIEILKKREAGFIYTQNQLFVGVKRENIEQKFNIKFESEKVEYTDEFKGIIAEKGNVKGKVRRVMGHKDISKIEKGEILISPMTMPDFIPAMKKASAFVTDEGSLTCHAAIVAREMKKPCIVGTKVATQILKDGMEVEVDANQGVVRVLKKEIRP